jgi:hypothetical protein
MQGERRQSLLADAVSRIHKMFRLDLARALRMHKGIYTLIGFATV